MQFKSTTSVSKRSNTIEGAEFWQTQINDYEKTTLNRRAYCRQHGLVYHRFKYWFNKFHKKSSTVKAIPIAIKSHPTHEALCTLKLVGGMQLLIHDKSVLTDVLARLL